MHADAVVVDTTDGYMWWHDREGALFTLDSAQQFADFRNDHNRTEADIYQVFTLATPECKDEDHAAMIEENGCCDTCGEWAYHQMGITGDE